MSPPSTSAAAIASRQSTMAPSTRPKSSDRVSYHSGPSRSSDDDHGKTAVKVAVRVRPPLTASDPSYDLIPSRFRGATCQVPNPTSLTVESPQGQKLFVFDRVFSDKEDQQGIWDYVSESVNSFVQGYNVSILAYGQSGAGKSYTMGTTSTGEQDDTNAMGIIPRAAESLFEKLSSSQSGKQTNGSHIRAPKTHSTSGLPTLNSGAPKVDDKQWELKVTYVEIYNEQLRDLLVPESIPQSERSTVTIREDTKGRIILTGLQQANIKTVDDLINALNFGSSIRQTDATNINSKSSRSHAVFSLNLIQKKFRASLIPPADKRSSILVEGSNGAESTVTVDSKLHFVDLAGSERLKNSGLTGERVKEGISINAGLASLGKVISQLSSRTQGSHVSYRDSRLTRLLQDSLGGNAITYMVACVNPIEFHLSETLNTVQYAQRARAIQSRPKIQQRADDSDKQLVIDRLRSEVAFLRDQIRSGERSERRNTSRQDRHSRSNDRQNELQNQLLDIQENYSALSQRHAKLIANMADNKGVDDVEDTLPAMPALSGALGKSSLDRLNRSNTFAEAVEQVVLEYEKTIQSLETSLSNSRSSLATSESSLLEREARIVYLEAVAQQLQARIQKAMDREANNESYLRDLEAKLDGVTNGEEKHLVIIKDLKKELARIRESETSAEEYISTLEERLAEAEQDAEIAQREMDRLEHVIERQRSVGKLDNLLQELDNINNNDLASEPDSGIGTREHTPMDAFHDRLVATASASHPNGEMHPEAAEEEWKGFGPMDGDEERTTQQDATASNAEEDQSTTERKRDDRSNNPAQARAVADKLETITIELFDLKVDHESTVAELEDVSRKYQIALSTLAELQDAVDEARSTQPSSFLDQVGMRELRADSQLSSSHMYSSELPSRGESPTLLDPSENGISDVDGFRGAQKEETLAQSIRRLKRANAEKDINMAELTESYSQLQDQHKDTLNYIDELKEEMQKTAQANQSPTTPQPMRRMVGHISSNNARESRVFSALRNLTADNFEGSREAKDSLETNINAAHAEAQLRNERIQTLETELVAVRKEMEVKNTMISGLTRERSARNNATLDTSVVATLRQQLAESQKQIEALREENSLRETDFAAEIQTLQQSLNNQQQETASAISDYSDARVEASETPANISVRQSLDQEHDQTRQQHITTLQKELSEWETRHQASVEARKTTESQLLATISDLESSLRTAENHNNDRSLTSDVGPSKSRNSVDWEAEKAKHLEQVSSLQKEIDGHKATADGHATKLSQLEQAYTQIIKEVEEEAKSKALTENELHTHRELVRNLEGQIDEQKSLATFHQQGLKALQENHSKELDELKMTIGAQQAEADQNLTEQLDKHKETTAALQQELNRTHMEMAELMQGVSSALDEDADSSSVHARIKSLAEDRKNLSIQHTQASEALVAAQMEMQDAKQITINLEQKVKELSSLNEETLAELERSAARERKSSKQVQDLEIQLNNNYDHQRDVSNKLTSALKDRDDVDKELEESRDKISQLEAQLMESRRMTTSSQKSTRDSTEESSQTLRKSTSHASLPSPPPAVPLPPLPGGINTPLAGSSVANAPPSPRPDSQTPSVTQQAVSPPPSRHASKDLAATAAIMQSQTHIEDLEQRIRTVEKHLYAEKQLTQTLEEALVDLETQSNKVKAEADAWKKKCREAEEEAGGLRRERGTMRNSLQAVEEERDRRIRAEQARRQLEERMETLQKGKEKKKNKGGLNCF